MRVFGRRDRLLESFRFHLANGFTILPMKMMSPSVSNTPKINGLSIRYDFTNERSPDAPADAAAASVPE